MEEELRRSEAEARGTVERLSRAQRLGRMGDWEWDVATGEVRWSEEIYRIYGVASDFETTFATIVPMTHPDDNDRNLRDAQAIIDDPGRSSGALRFRVVRPDGTVRHLFQTLAVDRDRDGKATRVSASSRTSPSCARSSRRWSRASVAFAGSTTPGSSAWPSGRSAGAITDANDRFLAMLGYTRGRLEAGAMTGSP